MKIVNTILLIVLLSSMVPAASQPQATGTAGNTPIAEPVPGFKAVLSLESPSGIMISPDGRYVLYGVNAPDWEKNTYCSQIWMAVTATGETKQMTFAKKSSHSYQWSPDSRSFAFKSEREDDKTRLYLMSASGGEGKPIAEFETSMNSYAWSPDGQWIAYTAPDPKSEKQKGVEKKYGAFDVIDEDLGRDRLWLMEVSSGKKEKIVDREELHVDSFNWSPDGRRIVFVGQPDNRVLSFSKADIYIVDVSTVYLHPAGFGTTAAAEAEGKSTAAAEAACTDTGTAAGSGQGKETADNQAKEKVEKYPLTPLVVQDGPDNTPEWSPDGKTIAFQSQVGTESYFVNQEICTIPAAGGKITRLTESFDENANLVSWKKEGIYFNAFQGMSLHFFQLNPQTGKMRQLSSSQDKHFALRSGSFSQDGRLMAFSYVSENAFPEVYYTRLPQFKPQKLTHFSSQVKDWKLAGKSAISWKSTDGAEITGVLIKPADFDPAKKYPLFVIIHGGPAGISMPQKYDGYNSYYPLEQWAAKGAVILEPNYRGSTGFGAAFRKLNYRNMGVGDYWDVISGVDYLIGQGFVDKDRVAAAGWSQGGYISAYITTFSDRFKAVSVGAGISDWVSYYYRTDITPFCIHYLGDTPWKDPEVYRLTSPMTYINQAKTPTLIQHGENDRRVPINNAYKLYRGLKDTGVPCKFIVYKGFGHGISNPKEKLAVLTHNWYWFNQYIFGEEPPEETFEEEKKNNNHEKN